ncbi:hypothetical protein [Peptoniphilus timonensis]|uniref:hypothetical protein n=1 Tax=Peptoniphilus timonensis TaxID=1268254 RepID=UPI00030D0B3D|nr:hypothetical protein [Peptoniphilus timonensis]
MKIREIIELWKDTWDDFELYQKAILIIAILFGFLMFNLLSGSIEPTAKSEETKPNIVVEDNFSRKEITSNYDSNASASINAEYEKLYKELLITIDSSYRVLSELENNIRKNNAIPFEDIDNNLIAPLNNQMMSFYDLYRKRGLGPFWKVWFENVIPTYSQFSTDYFYTIKDAQNTEEQLNLLNRARNGLSVFEEYIKKEYDNMYQAG